MGWSRWGPTRAAGAVLLYCALFATAVTAQDAATRGDVFQPAPAGPASGAPGDLRSLTPEGLRAAGPEALVRRAQAAYAARHYEEAARAYAELASMRPGVALYLYDLACCYGLMGLPEQAARFLGAAWEAGYRDLNHIEKDADFTRVRKSVFFEAKLDELRKDAARRDARKGRLLLIEAPAVQAVTVLEPEGYRPEGRYPLVIGLHGAGATADSFTDFFAEAFAKRGFLFCAPQGQYGLPLNSGGPMGYFWLPPDAAGKTVPSSLLAPTERYILTVLDSVARTYPVDSRNVYLLGFSQGAHIAFYVALKHPDLFRGAVPIAGLVYPEDYATGEAARGAKALKILVCQSPDDTRVSPADSEETLSFLRKMGGEPEVFHYPGGHVIRPEVVERAAKWIAAASAAEGSGTK